MPSRRSAPSCSSSATGPGAASRTVRLHSGEIEVEVVVDRALDLGRASIRGLPVSWLSPTGIVAPGLADMHGWGPFRSFFGGLLTTCGLDHTLGPTTADASHFRYPGQAQIDYPLHGRLTAVPARLTGYGIDWDAAEPAVFVRGEVRQATVFGEVLTLEREITIPIGGSTVSVRDTVRNDGFAPTPHLILYHVNLGWPLVGPGARVAGRVGEPRFATPAATGQDWRAVVDPARDVAEQVWEHTPRDTGDGLGRIGVVRDDIGDGRSLAVEIAWQLDTLPRLFRWRVMSERNYVIGLEPGNLEIEGRHAAAEAGRLVAIEPGSAVSHRLEITLATGPAAVSALSRAAFVAHPIS